MKHNYPLFNYKVFILLTVLSLFTVSCRKNTVLPDTIISNIKPTSLADLPENAKVQVSEINSWFKNYPNIKPNDQMMALAQQSVINGDHVVRVPIGTNSSVYFTKDKGITQTYLYKWLNKAPGATTFTGVIATYSFQDNYLRQLNYTNGKLIKIIDVKRIRPNGNMPDGKVLFESATLDYYWSEFLCFLEGGSWEATGEEDDDYIYFDCYGTGGYSAGGGGGGGGLDNGNAWFTGTYNPINNGGGNNGDTGGGAPWVGPNPCGGSTNYPSGSGSGAAAAQVQPNPSPIDDSGNGTTPPPSNNTGSGCGTGGSGSNYVPYPLTPSVSISVITEPQSSDVITDPNTGTKYYYSDIENVFQNNPQLIDQINANDDSQASSLPGPIISLGGAIFSQAYLNEVMVTKAEHPDWSNTQIYATALWNTIGGTTHFILDIAGFVPVIGEEASLINGGIYFIEGDKVNCALSLAAAIPVTGWVSIAGKWVKTVSTSVPVIEAAGKVAYRAVQVGREMRMVKVAVSAFDYASILALDVIKPADQTLTNISRYLIDKFGMRVVPSEATLKNLVDDIIQAGDATGSKTEQLSDALLQRDGYIKQPSQYGSNNGFDGVYIKGDPNNPTEIIINEAKQMASGGNVKLNPAGGKAAQMSDAWVNQTIDAMRNYSTDANIQNLGNVLFSNQFIITKTVTAVDKTTGEIVILKLAKY